MPPFPPGAPADFTETEGVDRASQTEAPYFEALRQHVETNVLSFHVPGHQAGRGADPSAQELFGGRAFAADITEVLGLDDIHRPDAQCKLAQELASQAFGADETHFLVNGSTSGIHAMLMAALEPGDLVLVPRNAHRSVWGGLVLCGARAGVYEPPTDEELGVYGVATSDCLLTALERFPEAKAILFVSPGYHGHCADTRALVALAHQRDLLVLADEAWGAHLRFHPDLPASAVTAGADLTVQSTHKMLPAFTQGAMLHVVGARVDRERLDRALRLLLTSSPSSLLVASLDNARRTFALKGRAILDEVISLGGYLGEQLRSLEGIRVRGAEPRKHDRVCRWDPTRLVVTALFRGYTGYELEAYLRYEHRLQIEMSDLFGVVIVLTAGHDQEHARLLVDAVGALPPRPAKAIHQEFPLPRLSGAAITPRDAFWAKTETLPWQAAAGRRSAETITLYPPGIPWLLPGEEVRATDLAELRRRASEGGKVQGASDPSLGTLRVLTENTSPPRKGTS